MCPKRLVLSYRTDPRGVLAVSHDPRIVSEHYLETFPAWIQDTCRNMHTNIHMQHTHKNSEIL